MPTGYCLSSALYDGVASIVAVLALPLLPFVALTRHGRQLSERLGRVPAAVAALTRPIWVHAASVGEVLAAEPLIQQLRRHHPELPILVSTTSLTGRETARTRVGADAVMLLPIDLRWIIDRVMRRLRPRCLVIVETELWPALLGAAARSGVPSVIVSGRISARAARRYAWIGWLTRAMLAHVRAYAMQTEADASRIRALGAPAERVQVVGSLKFARDVGVPSVRSGTSTAATVADGRVTLVAASTHPGEEQIVLDACAQLWDAHPDVLLVLAPRRPERFDEVAQWLERSGVEHVRRSELRPPVGRTIRVLLLDSIGELLDFFPASRAVFVGGTIAPVGGHNVLEPALFGKPVAFGPQTTNVAAAATALLDAGAATRISGAVELAAEWRRLLDDVELAQQMGERGRAVVAAHASVAERTYELVRRCMDHAG